MGEFCTSFAGCHCIPSLTDTLIQCKNRTKNALPITTMIEQTMLAACCAQLKTFKNMCEQKDKRTECRIY